MLRAVGLVIAATIAIGFSVAESQAQKKDKRCGPNFQTACMKQCSERGGQVRLCPQFCAKREKELGC